MVLVVEPCDSRSERMKICRGDSRRRTYKEMPMPFAEKKFDCIRIVRFALGTCEDMTMRFAEKKRLNNGNSM